MRSHTPHERSVDGDIHEFEDFDAFYAAHRDEIGRALAFTLGDPSIGQEAVDEAMARAYQRWDTLRSYESPAGWVYRTGLNWGRSWLRSSRRRRRREQRAARETGRPSDSPIGLRPDLAMALEGLSLDHRAVVVLRYYCDWSVEATAAALDTSEGTVKSRSARALEQLRTALDGNDAAIGGVR